MSSLDCPLFPYCFCDSFAGLASAWSSNSRKVRRMGCATFCSPFCSVATRHSPEQQFATSISRNRSSALTNRSQRTCSEFYSRSLLSRMIFFFLFCYSSVKIYIGDICPRFADRYSRIPLHVRSLRHNPGLRYASVHITQIPVVCGSQGRSGVTGLRFTYHCARGFCYEGATDATKCIISVVGCHGQSRTWNDCD
jgi:hypothetical protein